MLSKSSSSSELGTGCLLLLLPLLPLGLLPSVLPAAVEPLPLGDSLLLLHVPAAVKVTLLTLAAPRPMRCRRSAAAAAEPCMHNREAAAARNTQRKQDDQAMCRHKWMTCGAMHQ
jgi:hypothetical protein